MNEDGIIALTSIDKLRQSLNRVQKILKIRSLNQDPSLKSEIEKAYKKTLLLLKDNETNILIFKRVYLLELFDKKILDFDQSSGFPIFNQEMKKFFLKKTKYIKIQCAHTCQG